MEAAQELAHEEIAVGIPDGGIRVLIIVGVANLGAKLQGAVMRTPLVAFAVSHRTLQAYLIRGTC